MKNSAGVGKPPHAPIAVHKFRIKSEVLTRNISNPAGLARINQNYVIGSHQNLYGLSDLHNDMVAISIYHSFIQIGIAFQQINLINTYSEKIYYFSIAKSIKLNNIPIRFGSSFKYESANGKW